MIKIQKTGSSGVVKIQKSPVVLSGTRWCGSRTHVVKLCGSSTQIVPSGVFQA